jgi:hypothetical protein
VPLPDGMESGGPGGSHPRATRLLRKRLRWFVAIEIKRRDTQRLVTGLSTYSVMDPKALPSSPRRPWWATFSVRAHSQLRALAADILLDDRVILPRPADPDEYTRFVEAGWDPELQEAVERQAADSVYSVMWSATLREEWAAQWRRMTAAGKPDEAPFGATPLVMAQTERGREEIMAALATDTPLEQRPILLPAFQSAEEAQAELSLQDPVNGAGVGQTQADEALIVEMSRLVHEPALPDPEEALLAAAELAVKPSFQKARGNLLASVDRMARDDMSFEDARSKLRDLEDEYNTAVRDFRNHTWKRRAVIPDSGARWRRCRCCGGRCPRSTCRQGPGRRNELDTQTPDRAARA